ncbi:MAG: alpha-galactosidase [Dactylosporangium sp.]|nr:alpha-galactosidase [Dactylosporangium sp.]NNJ62283.1 alpha-galactosidase [Dactylosporangium sp.]
MATATEAAGTAYHDPATGTFLLTTSLTAYAVRVTGDGVCQLYWGPRLSPRQAAGLPLPDWHGGEGIGDELPAEGTERFGPAALHVAFSDGTEAVEWRDAGHTIDGGHLTLRLADRHYPLELELHYRVRPDSDVIERWTVLCHSGADDPVSIVRADTAAWSLPQRQDYRLSYVVGAWAAEFHLQRVRAPQGELTLTSRRGSTRHEKNPWIMVDPGDATEDHGEVWSTALAWGGTWRITAWRTLTNRLDVLTGAGHDGIRRALRPGECWTTPVAAGLYAADGFGGTSRRWHDYVRTVVLPRPDEVRPVLYNSWEGTWFDVDEASLRQTATLAAELGVELFVVDDGWFGKRINEHAALGDWWPNPDRFPEGLAPLIAHVHDLGMRFGIWVEPEMVNPDSELYRAHPDWALHMNHRRRTELRSQLVLNFARPDVAAWAHGWLDRLVTDHAIDFLKWDMNRAFTEAGWPGNDDPHRLYLDHTTAVYDLMDRLRADHPGLRIETCASGGGRVDLGILRRTDQAWASDNTDPVDRIAIQHGYGQVYPAVTMGAWASESPNPINQRCTPLRFRFHVAMAGALGVSGNLREWSVAERSEAAELIAAYQKVRHIVQHGHLYRRTPASPDRTTVVQYVSADGAETVVLAWRATARFGELAGPLRLAGLAVDADYRDAETGTVHAGAALTHHGLDLGLPPGEYASTLRHLRRG